MAENHLFAMSNGTVCVTTNRKRIAAADLYQRLIAKYGQGCADAPVAWCFAVRLSSDQIHAVLTKEELAPPALVEVPPERTEPSDWHEVPKWAKEYIEDLERIVGTG